MGWFRAVVVRLGAEKVGDLLGAGRPCVEVSLGEGAAHALQGSRLRGAFDSLGHHVEAEADREGHDSADEAFGGGVGVDVGDETAVDLQAVQRDLLKVQQ